MPFNFDTKRLAPLDGSKVRWIVVHTEGNQAGGHNSAEQVHAWHLKRGWAGIGYHYYIEEDGRAVPGRSLTYKGAGVEGLNHCTLHICLSGNGDHTSFNDAQLATLIPLLLELLKLYELTPAAVVGHRELVDQEIQAGRLLVKFATGKTCPGTKNPMQPLRRLLELELAPPVAKLAALPAAALPLALPVPDRVQIEPMEELMAADTKPGVKTTEFIITAATLAVGAAKALGKVDEATGNAVLDLVQGLVESVALVAAPLAYIWSRTRVKQAK